MKKILILTILGLLWCSSSYSEIFYFFPKQYINKLKEIEVELRDFSSMTASIDLDQLPEAKTIIREFRQKMASLLRNGSNKTDVYQLAIQFYPVTKLENTGELK